jgi:hypothetical protein
MLVFLLLPKNLSREEKRSFEYVDCPERWIWLEVVSIDRSLLKAEGAETFR